MADEPNDRDVSEKYGDLRRPEPPRALDDAILAASRRAVGARPGDADGGRRGPPTARWALPASVAAVLALSVMVTLHVQEERPGLEPPPRRAAPEATRDAAKPAAVEPAAPAAPAAAKEQAPAPVAVAPRVAEPAASRAAKGDAERSATVANAVRPPASPPAPAVAQGAQRSAPGFALDPPVATVPAAEPAPAARPAPAPLASAEATAARSVAGASAAPPSAPAVAAGSAAPAPAVAAAPRELHARGELSRDRAARDDARPAAKLADATETPERQLERIAQLRKEGRHEDADRLLKEFRARYPDYRIPDAMLEQVQPPR